MATRKNTTTTTPKAQPKAAPVKVKKSDQSELDRDWTYLAEKDPTDLHADMAAFILEITGLEVEDLDAFTKAVQLTSVLRHVYQRSDRNKQRGAYRGLEPVVVKQRSVHMIAAHQDAKAEMEKLIQAQEAAKAKASTRRRTAAAARKTA